MRKIGLVAGGGALPFEIARSLAARGAPFYVARVAGHADEALLPFDGEAFGPGEMGRRNAALKAAGCDAVVIAGNVSRPHFSPEDFDERGRALLQKLLEAAGRGDDALLRVLIDDFTEDGFEVLGAQDAAPELLAPAGLLAGAAPSERALADIKKGCLVASALGAWDIGQGCVVCDGLVLAVEAQEGTDRMLERVAKLPRPIRGTSERRRGVLVKRPKPQQERRIDLPTIGGDTLRRAAEAGLAGVAVEAGGSLLVEREAIVQEARDAGLFVFGFSAADERA